MKRNGFTLVELLIVLGILAFLSGLLALVFGFSTKTVVAAMEQNNLLNQMEEASRWISIDVENATGTIGGSSGNILCTIGQRATWNPASKSFDYYNIRYEFDGGVLRRVSQLGSNPSSSIYIAESIELPNGGFTSFTTDNASTRYYTLSLKVTTGNSSMSRVYKMHQVIY